jgi:CBS domain containing-hemolysin-like protein
MDSILIIILSLIFLIFFSGMKSAFLNANKVRIELDSKQDVFGSGIIKFFADHPGSFIAAMTIGTIISISVYAIASFSIIKTTLSSAPESDAVIIIYGILFSSIVLLIVAGLPARTFFIIAPNSILNLLSVPALLFYYIFYPVSKLMISVSGLFMNFFAGTLVKEKISENQLYILTEPDHFPGFPLQDESESAPMDNNIKILQNALDFSHVKLWECMVPRTEIKAVDIETPVSELRSLFVETQHSRLLVYKDSIDNVIGYFDLKDIFKDPADIKSYIRKVIIVPETMAANRLLKMFVDQKKNVALVVDEFGGTSGMITIEDVVEEIVGDIEDEHDINELTEKAIGNNEYIFSARLEIDYLNEKYNFSLPEEDDYKTLAGLILFYHGSIPVQNDIIRVKNTVFKVLKVNATRIELVNVKVEVK